MKVLQEASKGVSAGARIALGDIKLPIAGANGLLIVFWKEQ